MTTPRRRTRRDPSAPPRPASSPTPGSQADSGAGLDAQRATLTAEADRRDWTLEFVTDAGISGGTLNRPALTDALERLDRGDADVLLASKIDRVSRSVADFAGLLDRARRHGWQLVVLDVATEGPAGEFAANVVAAAAQYERSLASQRTREGLAARKAAGVRLGRPSSLSLHVVQRIVGERATGRGLRVIAEGLTQDGVPTARGGATWSTSTVQGVLASQHAARITAPAV